MNKEIIFNSERQKPIPELSLKRKYINAIKLGEKTTEGRINSGFFRNINQGDRIKFFNENKPYISVVCEIKEINKYKGFREMLEKEGYSTMVPDVKSLDEAVRVYDNIPNYTERAKEKGVLALKLRVVR